jgi:(2Fe-2S) ferredoxin
MPKLSNAETGDYIKVGMSTCGLAAGAEETYRTFSEEVKKHNLKVKVEKCGCLGMCYAEPLAEVKTEGLPAVTYGRVDKNVAIEIIEKHFIEKTLVNDHIFDFKYQEYRKPITNPPRQVTPSP